MFYNRTRSTENSNNQNNQNTRKTYVVAFNGLCCNLLNLILFINKIMAANISDTDVILDTEGITVPECAHGMI